MTLRIGTAMPAVSVRRPVHSVKPLEEETLVGVLIFVLMLTYRLACALTPAGRKGGR